MTASQLRPRLSWAPPRPWNVSTYWPVIPMLAAAGIWTFDLACEASAPSERQLSTTFAHRLSRLPASQAEGLDPIRNTVGIVGSSEHA